MNFQEKFEVIPTKGLTKYLINGHIILNGAKHLSKGITKFISANKRFKFFSDKNEFTRGNLKECQKENLKYNYIREKFCSNSYYY